MELLDKVKINAKFVLPITPRLRETLSLNKGDILAFYRRDNELVVIIEKMPTAGV